MTTILQTGELTGYPSIDKPWLKYFTEDDRNIEIPKCTIFQNIFNRNKEFLSDIALNFYGNRISYARLFSEVKKCTKTLKSIGIKKGECINLCTAGVPEAVYMVLACSRIGAIANFINPMFSKDQMVDRINDTEAEWILILDAMYGYIKEALHRTCIKHVVIIPATNSVPLIVSKLLYLKSDARRVLKDNRQSEIKYHSWNEFITIGKAVTGNIDIPYEEDTPAVMVYSSGTTGASKGILLTNDGMNATIAHYQSSCFAYERKATMLMMIPIWFSTGIVLSLLMPLTNGVTVILEPKFSKEVFAEDILKYRPSICLTATSLWIYVMEAEEMKKADLSHFLYPFTGGERVLQQDEIRLNKFLKERSCDKYLYKGYGMCELGSTVATFGDAKGYKPKAGGNGYPMLNAIVSAFDIETDEELTYGEHGEIRVCSPGSMKGYYKNPQATSEFFKTDSQGRVWGCTGDIGYVDEDGEVFVLGRVTDHCKRDDGKIVYLFDIEERVFDIFEINQCKVVDTTIDGKNRLVLHIVLCEGVSNKEEVIIKVFENLRKTLPEYMVPEFYKIRESMPVHSNGKRDVSALKEDRTDIKRA